MQPASLLADIEKHVKDLFSQYPRPYLRYHNLYHTLQVVSHTKEIAQFYKYNDPDLFMLMAAAWFHDTGYLLADNTEMHEQKSIELMAAFLSSKNVAFHIIENVSKNIMATKMPVSPQTLSEKIICDADMYHLGTDDFFNHNQLVKEELEAKLHKPMENWRNSSLSFLITHQYFTTYCQELLNAGKQKNLQKLIGQNAE
jgi:predicted metal-dependent HD superfamily phosphohydrolase